MTHDECWYKNTCNKYLGNIDNCRGCIRFFEMYNLMKLSNIPENRWKPIRLLSGEDKSAYMELQEVKKDILNWVDDGRNLYIYSKNCGNGKTSWSIKLMQSYFDKIWAGNGMKCRGVFISVPVFLLKNKEIINKFDNDFVELKQRIMEADLVIWDDIASTKLSEFDHSLLLAYIDTRILNGKANIFTGNINPDNMKDMIGERLASRVVNSNKIIEFRNSDMRSVIV